MALRSLWVEGTEVLTGSSGTHGDAPFSPKLSPCSGKLILRAPAEGGWALAFSPFKAQIAEIEEIPGQAERSFKQTLYNRL